ncbi:MAG: 50S ribosomal protein L9 [Chloroflexi bacterium RBG_16_50_11]|nr:MAG: 50S ribosomal protein L9 [Chloroflexi bacterium RBG_16_50_11]
MKVIFIADVPNVARAGQTREVADGYARNFLFPRKLAVLANSQAAAAVEAHLKKLVKQRAIEEAEMATLAKQISGTEITLKAKVGENDKLYGSVTGADIAESLSKSISREIDKRKVDLAEPIRQVGVYDVTIKFTHDITAIVKVTVMSDAEGAEVPVKAVKAEAPPEEKPEKAEKKEKKPKKEKPPKEPQEEKPAQEEIPAAVAKPAEEKAEKPAKEKKVKAEKAEKEEKLAKEEKPAAEKKEKKPKSKAKKSEDKAEEKQE